MQYKEPKDCAKKLTEKRKKAIKLVVIKGKWKVSFYTFRKPKK